MHKMENSLIHTLNIYFYVLIHSLCRVTHAMQVLIDNLRDSIALTTAAFNQLTKSRRLIGLPEPYSALQKATMCTLDSLPASTEYLIRPSDVAKLCSTSSTLLTKLDVQPSGGQKKQYVALHVNMVFASDACFREELSRLINSSPLFCNT